MDCPHRRESEGDKQCTVAALLARAGREITGRKSMTTEPREAIASDLDLLASIHAQCFSEGWTADALGALLETPGTFALVISSSGFIQARVAADEAEILTLGVLPALRGRGLGAVLVKAAAERAARASARTIFLEVVSQNVVVKVFYTKLGFRMVGHRKGYYGPQNDALVLKAALPLTFGLGNSRETA